MLTVDGLTITVGPPERGRVLVQGVDLRLARGETLGIVGESGSGKSLTARSLVGLLPRGLSAVGRATFDGESLLDASERQLRRLRGSRISLLLQDPFTMLNPLQTIGTHLVESLRKADQSRDTAKREVERRLDEVALSADVAKRYPFQLSGGMRQRAALATALARDPDLLIADEATTALDVTTQEEVLRLLKEIQASRGMALILITHDLRLAFSVCDTIQVMYAGAVVERAPAAQLSEQPLHPYSFGLLGATLPLTEYVSEIKSIPGRVPPASEVLSQCPFAARCAWARDECVAARPPLASVATGRWSACTRIGEIAAELGVQTPSVDASVPQHAVRPQEDAPIVVTELRKSYRTSSLLGARETHVALDGVSLTVGEGESVGLVGETGSGKSTIARCILGLTRPASGHITIDGVDAGDFRALSKGDRRRVRSCVQAVFQDPYSSLNPAVTIGATLREVLDFRGSDGERAQTVTELLESVGLPASYASRRPAALSGGERQRVAIARALAMRPRVLICDEPVASLDVSAQAQILELLRRIRRERHMAMLFITHDLAVVRQIAERTIVLYHGSVVEEGATEAVLSHPEHDYTRQLLSAASR